MLISCLKAFSFRCNPRISPYQIWDFYNGSLMVLQKMPPPYGGDKAFRKKKMLLCFQEEPCWDYFHMASPCVLGDL